MGKCECGGLKGNPCGPLRPNTINVTMPVNALVGASEDVPKRDPGNLRSNRGQGIDTWEEVQPT